MVCSDSADMLLCSVPLRALQHAGPRVGLAVGPPAGARGEDLEAVTGQDLSCV